MKLLVGLGNPDSQYLFTPHNIGFMLIDALSSDSPFRKKHKSLIQKNQFEKEQVCLVKPQTYMNLSGQAVREIMDFYNLDLEDLLVIQDDMDMRFSNLKFQKGRGAGGHNGIRDIHEKLGSPDYARLKLGIAPHEKEKASIDTAKYVLSPFSKDQQNLLPDFLKKSMQAVQCFIKHGLEQAANQFNQKDQ